ncbi:MAG: nuclear transport factor 2 family protein, partial [Paracoccaceae bacterium]|nr:nuclear transport factor 2 family protein [Paracoccaceae bacterium]
MNRRSLFATLACASLATALPLTAAHAADGALGVVEAYLAAWNAHDSSAAAAHLAENVSYYDASVGTPVVGREAAKTGVIDNFLNAAPDAVWTMQGSPVVQDGKVAFEWQFKGTNTGAWADGTPATGKTFSFTGASVFVVTDGLVA